MEIWMEWLLVKTGSNYVEVEAIQEMIEISHEEMKTQTGSLASWMNDIREKFSSKLEEMKATQE